MSDPRPEIHLPPEQEAIRAKCFHPTGSFIEFKREEIEQSIPDRFEQIVAKYPERIAVKTPSRQLTYEQLNGAANRVAHAILAQRGEREESIALLLEHDVPMLVAIIGVLKAGKICVILDPSFPTGRIAYLLEDSKSGLLVTDRKNVSLAKELVHDKCRLMNLDELDAELSAENPLLSISPDNFTYIVYTSGSTGRPKGVLQNHRNGLHEAMLYANGLHICVEDRLALLYSCSTSQGIKITFAAVLSGAALCPFNLPEEGVSHLAEWLLREEITIYFSVPIVFRQWVSAFTGREKFPKLRLIQLGSDSVTLRELEEYKKHFSPSTIFVVRLGSTETGTIRRCFFDGQMPFAEKAVPVGYAVEDTEVSLLDDEGKKVDFNRVGEIAVKSRYLSPGYWRRDDLTQAKFLPDPNGGDRRTYLTDDLGRITPDGCLYHLGRRDFQVKIGGHRIELSEIEEALRGIGAIQEAVVVAREDTQGDKRLVAYVVPAEDVALSIGEIRSFVEEKLPAFMVPSGFVMLEALPLTPNGKIDRGALPIPDNSRRELGEDFVAPRTQVEQVLAHIWAEVLNLKPIGIHDNFFELAGDSIRTMQILARANQAGLRLTPKDMSEHQTIAELAAFVGVAPATEVEPETVTGIVHRRSPQAGCYTPADFPLAKLGQRQLERILQKLGKSKKGSLPNGPQEIEDIYPLSPAQWAMLFYSLCYPADSGVYHQEFCYSLRGDLDIALFERSWRQMVERHSILRTAFLTEPLQVVKRHASLPLDYRDWRGLSSVEQEEQLEEFLQADRRRRFEIAQPPLMRLALFHKSQNHYRFIWSSHHVLLDGWSRSILWKEVLACYQALSRGREPDWQPAPPFRDYIAWLQQQEQRNSEAETFWRGLLKDFTVPMPQEVAAVSRRPREKKETYGGVQVHLSRDETARLQAFALEHRLTMNTLAQAAWALLLSRYSGESDVLFGGVLSVRPSAIPGVESMVGPLINVLPIRVQLAPRDSVRAFLRKLHRQQVEMRQHDHSSLAKVQEWSGVPRRTTLFDSLFLFQNYPESPVREQGGRFEIRLDRVFGRTTSPLAIVMRPGPELSLAIGFDEDRFDKDAIKDMLGDFQALLRAIVADPERSVADSMKASASASSWSAATPGP